MTTLTKTVTWTEIARLSVCIGCYMESAGVNDDVCFESGPYPLDLIPEEWTVDPGDADEHFSWSPCEGCGSTLGGGRFELIAGEWSE